MAIRKPSIPAVTPTNISTTIGAIKENIELITGARQGELAQLAATASTADIITKINQIVIRMNASGK
jgi:hypothetical protein